MVSAKPKLSLTVALGRADFSGGHVMLMLCGPDPFTLMVMLAVLLAPVMIVSALVMSIIIKINAGQRQDHLKTIGRDTGIGHSS